MKTPSVCLRASKLELSTEVVDGKHWQSGREVDEECMVVIQTGEEVGINKELREGGKRVQFWK